MTEKAKRTNPLSIILDFFVASCQHVPLYIFKKKKNGCMRRFVEHEERVHCRLNQNCTCYVHACTHAPRQMFCRLANWILHARASCGYACMYIVQ